MSEQDTYLRELLLKSTNAGVVAGGKTCGQERSNPDLGASRNAEGVVHKQPGSNCSYTDWHVRADEADRIVVHATLLAKTV